MKVLAIIAALIILVVLVTSIWAIIESKKMEKEAKGSSYK